MAADVADWTQSVNVAGGSVSITGTATVQITGTPTVSISGTPSVNIANTPAVTINSGSVTATISGTPNVNLQSSSITLNVSVSNTPAVTISGTPSVTISSGSVTIANANIAVINATGTKITSSRPPLSLGTILIAASTTSTITTAVLPSDIHALVVVFGDALANYQHLKIAWSGGSATSWVPFELYTFAQSVYALPILPSEVPSGGLANTKLDITLQTNANGFGSVQVWAIFEGEPEWLTVFPQPKLAPNQSPLVNVNSALAINASTWLIAPAANVSISLFEVILDILLQTPAGSGTQVIVGHGAALPGANPPTSSWLLTANLLNAPFTWEFHGAQLPAGEGVWVMNFSTTVGSTIYVATSTNYSLS